MKPGWVLGFAIFGAAVLAALIVSLVQGIPSPEDAYRPSTISGGVVYLEACAKCHGVTGEGSGLAPSLKGRGLPLARIRSHVKFGTGKMPSFPYIDGEALKNLSQYVSNLR
jgi:mono/diheme cytochrome c family protein